MTAEIQVSGLAGSCRGKLGSEAGDGIFLFTCATRHWIHLGKRSGFKAGWGTQFCFAVDTTVSVWLSNNRHKKRKKGGGIAKIG
jgi:hypothetical protein